MTTAQCRGHCQEFSCDSAAEKFHAFDDYIVVGAIHAVAWGIGDIFDNVQPLDHLPEDRMAVVEVWCGAICDEELAAIGVWTGVGHAQDARAGVAKLGVKLIFEAVTGATTTTASGIATLNHKTGDHSVEDDAVVKGVVAGFECIGIRPGALARGEADEVGDRFWGAVFVKRDDDVAVVGVQRRMEFTFTGEVISGCFVKRLDHVGSCSKIRRVCGCRGYR